MKTVTGCFGGDKFSHPALLGAEQGTVALLQGKQRSGKGICGHIGTDWNPFLL